MIGTKTLSGLALSALLGFAALTVGAGEAEGFHNQIHQEMTSDALAFLKPDVIEDINDEHIYQEVFGAFDSTEHFDACLFADSRKSINDNYGQALDSADPDNPRYSDVTDQLGQLLHGAQDFYSHSNWVDLDLRSLVDEGVSNWEPMEPYEPRTPSGSARPIVFVAGEDQTPFDGTLERNGRFVTANVKGQSFPGVITGAFLSFLLPDDCPDNVVVDHDELNKDSPGRPNYGPARQLAYEQTKHEFYRLVGLVFERYGGSGVSELLAAWEEPALGELRMHTLREQDAIAPTISCAADKTVEGNTTGGAHGVVADRPLADDQIVAQFTQEPVVTGGSLPSFLPLGSTTDVTWQASDFSDMPERGPNRATCAQKITVVDTTPPEISVPADLTVNATGLAGAAVTYSASARDVVDANPSLACIPPSGSVFPNGRNAPRTTTVTCTASDANGNTATREFAVTVLSPFGYLGDFVVLARDWATLGSGASIGRGNVGVFQQSDGAPRSPGLELVAGPRAVFAGESRLAAHSVQLKAGTLAGDVFHVDSLLTGPGVVFAAKPGYVPLFSGLPAVPAFTAGIEDRRLRHERLVSGSYRDVVLQPNASVTLTGGNYFFRSIELKPGARLLASAPSTLHVTESFSIGPNGHAGPLPGSGAQPSELFLYALGAQGLRRSSDTIDVGPGAALELNAYAPDGVLSFGPESRGTGAFLGRAVQVGADVTLTEDSSFVVP
jgi:hypothetical protein